MNFENSHENVEERHEVPISKLKAHVLKKVAEQLNYLSEKIDNGGVADLISPNIPGYSLGGDRTLELQVYPRDIENFLHDPVSMLSKLNAHIGDKGAPAGDRWDAKIEIEGDNFIVETLPIVQE